MRGRGGCAVLCVGLLLLATVAVVTHDPMARSLAAAFRSIERASAAIHASAPHKDPSHVRH